MPSLQLGEGEHVALKGASGSGKTTLLHIVAGILAPDTGSVVLAGHEVEVLSADGRRARLLRINVSSSS